MHTNELTPVSHHVKNTHVFKLRSLWENPQHVKPKLTKKKRGHHTLTCCCCYFVLLWLFAFLFLYCAPSAPRPSLHPVSSRSHPWSVDSMLLCINAIVAFVTTMVCGFRSDITYRVYRKKKKKQTTKRTRQNKENQLKRIKTLFECPTVLLPSVLSYGFLSLEREWKWSQFLIISTCRSTWKEDQPVRKQRTLQQASFFEDCRFSHVRPFKRGVPLRPLLETHKSDRFTMSFKTIPIC